MSTNNTEGAKETGFEAERYYLNKQIEILKAMVVDRDLEIQDYRKALRQIAYGFFPKSRIISEDILSKYRSNQLNTD